MRALLLSVIFAIPLTATANSELNNSDVVADQSEINSPDPSARSVVIRFNSKGVPIAIAHTDKERVATTELDKLQFAQVTAAAEEPGNFPDSTPATETKNSQGTPQWGFAGGAIRGPRGGVIAGGRAWGGGYRGGYGGGYGYAGYRGNYGGYGGSYGGYGGDYGGYGGGYASYGGGWNTGWNSSWSGCGWGGCGCSYGCSIPVYYYAGCAYQPIGFYGGGWGGASYAGGDFYGMYQPGGYY